MPESPEVHAFVEFLAERAVGHAIRSFDVRDFRALKTRTVAPAVLVGARIEDVTRHGKHVDVRTDREHLVWNFGRNGWGVWFDPLPDVPEAGIPPVVARLHLDDGSGLELTDAGSFAGFGLWLTDDPASVPAIAKLGPDPADADFSRADFDRAFAGRRKQVKAILQEQESLAGIGNAYSDEILHAARVPPTVHASALDAAALDRLFAATKDVVRDAIAARRGIPPSSLKAAKVAAMRVHGRGGEACPVCGGTVEDFTFGGTSAQWCPNCQAA